MSTLARAFAVWILGFTRIICTSSSWTSLRLTVQPTVKMWAPVTFSHYRNMIGCEGQTAQSSKSGWHGVGGEGQCLSFTTVTFKKPICTLYLHIFKLIFITSYVFNPTIFPILHFFTLNIQIFRLPERQVSPPSTHIQREHQLILLLLMLCLLIH